MFYYKDLLKEISAFCSHGLEVGEIGKSQLGQSIPYVFVGNKNGRYLIVQGAMHAREHLTALLVVGLAKYLVKNKHLPILGGIYFVPMTNPDGVRLCQEGVGFLRDKEQKSNLLAINGSADFSLWKANIDGVDLNVNFDADWSKGKSNVFCKSSQNYVGSAPFSAKESYVLAQFTQKVKPCCTLSYHLKGEEIYWQFGQTSHRKYRDKKMAQWLSSYTGYKVVDQLDSAGGYKDWCVQKLKIPAFTIEVGNDKFDHPFPYEQYSTILSQNEDLPRRLLNSVIRYNYRLAKLGLSGIMDKC